MTWLYGQKEERKGKMVKILEEAKQTIDEIVELMHKVKSGLMVVSESVKYYDNYDLSGYALSLEWILDGFEGDVKHFKSTLDDLEFRIKQIR